MVKNIKTKYGRDDQLDEKKILNFLISYSLETDNQQYKGLILQELEPLLLSLAWKYGGREEKARDFFQEGSLKALEMLEKWDTTRKGTIGGYFRVGVANYLKTLLSKEEKKIVDFDPFDENLHSPTLKNKKEITQEDVLSAYPLKGSFSLDNEWEAYSFSIKYILLLDNFKGGKTRIQQVIQEKYGLTVQKSKLIVNHALISVRLLLLKEEKYLSRRILDVERECAQDSILFRFLTLLKEGECLETLLGAFRKVKLELP